MSLIFGLQKPLHGSENVKSSVANDESVLRDLALKNLPEFSQVKRQSIGKIETKF
jgi:hypothetical protein